jgi:tetratricopeptide (TPR) repeat protein
MGKVDEAIRCFRKAIAIEPRYALVHSNLADALSNCGKWDDAIALYKHAIALAARTGGFRYDAACSAAQAGCDRGVNSGKLTATRRLALRRQALTWLRAELAAMTVWLRLDSSAHARHVLSRLGEWQKNPDLAGLRDEIALKQWTVEERNACRRLWADVADLLNKAKQGSPRIQETRP